MISKDDRLTLLDISYAHRDSKIALEALRKYFESETEPPSFEVLALCCVIKRFMFGQLFTMFYTKDCQENLAKVWEQLKQSA